MGRDRLTAPLHHSVVSALRANSRGIWLRQGVKDQTERLPSREPRRIFLCLQIPTGVQPGIIQLKGLDFWKQTSLVLVQNWTGAEELFPSAILKTKSQRMDSDPQPPTPFLRSTWVYRPVLWHKIIKAPPPKKKKKTGTRSLAFSKPRLPASHNIFQSTNKDHGSSNTPSNTCTCMAESLCCPHETIITF